MGETVEEKEIEDVRRWHRDGLINDRECYLRIKMIKARFIQEKEKHKEDNIKP